MPACRGATASLGLALAVLLGAEPVAAELSFGSVGAELDEESGYVVTGALGGAFAQRTTWDLAASHSDTATTLSDLTASAIDGSLYQDFGRLGIRLRVGGWVDRDFIEAHELGATFDIHGEGWTVALETQLRSSDFEPIEVNRTITLRDGRQVTIQGVADCAVDDTGLGARVGVWSGSFSFSISTMSYDYDGFGCDFSIPVLDALRSSTRDEFVQLADNLSLVLSLGAGRRLIADNALLDSRVSLSMSHDTGLRSYNVYYDSTEDVFFGRTANTLSAGIGFPLRSGNEIEIYAGVTEFDTRSTIAFLGWYWLIAP